MSRFIKNNQEKILSTLRAPRHFAFKHAGVRISKKVASVKKFDQKVSISTLKTPWLLAFKHVGPRITRMMPYFGDLGANLRRGGIKIGLESYVSLAFFLPSISFLSVLGTTLAVTFMLQVPALIGVLFAIGMSTLSAVFVFGIIYAYPALLAISRRKRLDLELPYVASHMSILAAAGIPPARMFKLLEDSVTTPQVASESNEIVRDVEVLGNDIITALEAERARSPSRVFSEVLEGLVATIRSGGNMKNFLLDTTRSMMDLRRVASKQMVESLASFAEIYVTLLVVFPLLIIVMFSVMAMIGGGLGGMSVTTLMIFVTYVIIPLCGIAVIVMLDSMLVED